MPIYYDLVRRLDPRKTGEPQPFYPQAKAQGTIGLKELLEDMGTKVDEATLLRTLTALRGAVCKELMRSRRVHIEGWGTFFVRLEGRPVDDPEEIHAQSISVADITFQPEKDFVHACRQGKIVRDDNGFAASKACTLDEQLRILADHFAEESELTATRFKHLTGLIGGKAYEALDELMEKGYLLRKGRRASTHYVRTDKPLE